MTARRQVQAQRDSLGEIRGIMNAMKNLAFMETRKLERYLDAQQAVVGAIEAVADDFAGAFPNTLPAAAAPNRVCLLVGSERGFCGDFNAALLRHPALAAADAEGGAPTAIIATGRKLHTLLAGDPRLAAQLEGASVAEEVPAVLTRVVDALAQLQARYGVLSLQVLFHADSRAGVTRQRILPPFQRDPQRRERYPVPPLLNLPPAAFLVELSDHYLFAALHRIFYASLMAENERRVQHLDAAVDHLDRKAIDLQRRVNALRQEEIIEEIEVILLNRAGAEPEGGG